MARKPRVEFPDAFYHVIARGNQRREIFRDDADRSFYLERLELYRKRYDFTLYAYVLMSNHVHLLIETHRTPLSKIMQGFQFTYTQHFNRRYRTVGHLFQGRYQAILCDREAYLLELVRYLHLNPARLRHRLDPWHYPWSSHRAYLGESCPVRVETALVLGQFGREVGRARRAYLRFMEEGLPLGHVERYYETVNQRFLGDEGFIREVDRRAGARGEVEGERPRVIFPLLLQVVAREHGVDEEGLVRPGRQRKWVRARSMLVYLAREWGRVSAKELGRRLHRDSSMISRLYALYATHRDERAEARIDQELKQKVKTHA